MKLNLSKKNVVIALTDGKIFNYESSHYFSETFINSFETVEYVMNIELPQ